MSRRKGPTPARGHGRGLLALWLVVAALFGTLLVLAGSSESGLDDPDPAWQRPGILDLGGLPLPAPSFSEGQPRLGHRAVVFFVRPDSVASLCRSLRSHHLRETVDIAVVVSGTGQCLGSTVREDPSARVAQAYGLRRPRDGGAPVGYAVVDSHGRIRYRTLDPDLHDDLQEVDTIVAATP